MQWREKKPSEPIKKIMDEERPNAQSFQFIGRITLSHPILKRGQHILCKIDGICDENNASLSMRTASSDIK